MTRYILAKSAGYCFGVERSVEIAEKALHIAASICVFTNDNIIVEVV